MSFLNKMIKGALELRASDIHFIQTFDKHQIKFRLNDHLVDYLEINDEDYQQLMVFIKFKSNMNLNGAKGPQSSALNLIIDGESVRIRVSTIMTLHRNSLVLRLSHCKSSQTSDLLLVSDQETILYDSIGKRNGLVLISGPTGSGKTTLTYSLLHYLKEQGKSIVTVEDPVEHVEHGFVQLQINESGGINYEVSVKEILRHDPDIIFIGEIRDSMSAKSAIRASLSGHMVISTLHSSSAIKALYRLLELGVSQIELEQTLVLLTNQRLAYNHENQKKVILEYLMGQPLSDAINSTKYNEHISYKTINELMSEYPNYQVIK